MKRYIRAGRTYFDYAERANFDVSRKEKNFERLLQEHGYTILGYREYYGHTAYKVEKEGIVIETTFVKGGNPKGTIALLDDLWQLKKKTNMG